MIKRIVQAAALVIAAVIIFPHAPAHAVNAPWCAVISTGPSDAYWDCQYRSVEECVPHVISGNRGTCSPNPAFTGVAEQPKRRSKRR